MTEINPTVFEITRDSPIITLVGRRRREEWTLPSRPTAKVLIDEESSLVINALSTSKSFHRENKRSRFHNATANCRPWLDVSFRCHRQLTETWSPIAINERACGPR